MPSDAPAINAQAPYRSVKLPFAISSSRYRRKDAYLVALRYGRVQPAHLPDVLAVEKHPDPDRAVSAEYPIAQPRFPSHAVGESLGHAGAFALHAGRAIGAGETHG
jgi:hypothetical protein